MVEVGTRLGRRQMNEHELLGRMAIAEADGVEISEERIVERLGHIERLRRIYTTLMLQECRGGEIDVGVGPVKGDVYHVIFRAVACGFVISNTLAVTWRKVEATKDFSERERSRVGCICAEILKMCAQKRDEAKRARAGLGRKRRKRHA